MNKYEIVLKYNENEVVYAEDKDRAVFDFKESTPIQLKGKGCDSIVEVRLLKQYTKEEWKDRLQRKKANTRKQLAMLVPETYKLEGDKFYVNGVLEE